MHDSGMMNLDKQEVLEIAERLHEKLKTKGDFTHGEKLLLLRDTLKSPLFNQILTVQQSIKQLKEQLNRMPADRSAEFDFTKKGLLVFEAGSSARLANKNTSLSFDNFVSSRLPHIGPNSTDDEFSQNLQQMAKGRKIEYIDIEKPSVGGLGFSVVALKNPNVGEAGVFVKEVQPGTIADRDGRLQEGDQLLAINSTLLDINASHQEAITLLQQSSGSVYLVVAKKMVPSDVQSPTQSLDRGISWGHMEEIELINDGSGLGFGIVGGKASGVIVRTIVPGGLADRDERLRTGDYLLQIGDTNVHGMSSDQVAQVLRNCGNSVRMVIARNPVGKPLGKPPPPPAPATLPVGMLPPKEVKNSGLDTVDNDKYDITLTKREGQSLGITVVGYTGAVNGGSSGIFVKSIIPGSAAEQSGRIKVYDRIIAVNGVDIQGYSNQDVVTELRNTGQTVHLTLSRNNVPIDSFPQERSPARDHTIPVVTGLPLLAEPPKAEINTVPDVAAVSEHQVNVDKLRNEMRAGPLSPEFRALKSKWEKRLGSEYLVMVVDLDAKIEDDAELQKYSKLLPIHTMRLGVELDSYDGHHYISSIAPDGPVANLGILQPEDELLEVNHVQLYGKSRREAVSFLKEVPPPFTLVCCRRLGDDENESFADEANVLDVQDEPPEDPLLHVSHQLPQSDGDYQTVIPGEDLAPEEDDGELAMWSSEIKVVELEKDHRGLGFSILDYQDPLDPARTVIVVQALVTGGVAEESGQILPGDRLVFVNENIMDNASLDAAVDILTSAPSGTTRLGICKPFVNEFPVDSGNFIDEEFEERPDVVPADLRAERYVFHPKYEEEAYIEETQEELVDDPSMVMGRVFHAQMGGSQPLQDSWEMQDLGGFDGGREMLVDEEYAEQEFTHQDSDLYSPHHQAMAPSLAQDPGYHQPWVTETPSELLNVGLPFYNPVPKPDMPLDEEDVDLHVETVVDQGPVSNLKEPRLIFDPDAIALQTEFEKDKEYPIAHHQQMPWNQLSPSSSSTHISVHEGDRELPEREEGEGEETPLRSHWGPSRVVKIWKEPQVSLGISIVGGQRVITRLKNGEDLKGIFIKQVLEDSPAGRSNALKTGDKIIEVSGVDLRNATHGEAVDAIKKSGNPVVFVIQNLLSAPRSVSPVPALASGGLPPPMKLPPPYKDQASSMPPDTDVEEQEESDEKIRQRYADLPGELLIVELDKDQNGLGLSLAGNKDRSQMSIFVVAINPDGPAGRDGRIYVGDELLELNNQVLYGKSHQNASAIIKSAPSKAKLVLIRNRDAVLQMAINPNPLPPGPQLSNREQPDLPVPSREEEERLGELMKSLMDPEETKVQFSNPMLPAVEENVLDQIANQLKQSQNSPSIPYGPQDVYLSPSASYLPVEPEMVNQRMPSSFPMLSFDPASCPIIHGQETTIDISKGHSGLGLSIVGGNDTPLEAIVIHEVYEEGAAARDGRLWPVIRFLKLMALI
uniref:InaD-like protein n=1 Tax=Leptobrachium leishanense TaxID=445787 RepID=A0A8C5WLQ9_9ANUR